ALAADGSQRPVLWLHAARDREHHPFVQEVRNLMSALPNGRVFVCYSRPGSNDEVGKDFDAAGHLSRTIFDTAGVRPEADVYLCGPGPFMTEMQTALANLGV